MKGAIMNKNVVLASILALVALNSLIGCDNRSQLQKDIDKAASSAEDAANDAQKKLGM